MDPRIRAEARIGAVLNDKWTLERLLGVGGMASVYAARHRNGARMAIKILHPDLAKSEEVNRRFLREGYAANRVDHSGVVRVLDDDVVHGGSDDGTAYLVMELLEGESLESWMHRVGLPMDEEEVLAIAEQVLDVLVHAHPRGVVHRDLKPENLFLERRSRTRTGNTRPAETARPEPPKSPFGWERVKVLDFGLARVADSALVTRAGVALGTPSVMSPEQAAGRTEELDGRSDLFSLGSVMFRMLTGRRVHEADSPINMVLAMSRKPAPPIRSIRPSVSEAVANIIDRALQFRREDRYPHAGAMRADVMAARSGHSLPSSIADASTVHDDRGIGREAPVVRSENMRIAQEISARWADTGARAIDTSPPRRARRGPSGGFWMSLLWIGLVGGAGYFVLAGGRSRLSLAWTSTLFGSSDVAPTTSATPGEGSATGGPASSGATPDPDGTASAGVPSICGDVRGSAPCGEPSREAAPDPSDNEVRGADESASAPSKTSSSGAAANSSRPATVTTKPSVHHAPTHAPTHQTHPPRTKHR